MRTAAPPTPANGRSAMGVLGTFAVDLFRWPPSPPAVADATR